MRVFLKVVEEGNFSTAARAMDKAPSSVSRQIVSLEDELGALLFNRTTRRQSLTEAGEIFYEHASRIISDIDGARLAVSQLTKTPSGTLNVTVEPDFASAFIAPLLPLFSKSYPDIHIRFFMDAGHMDIIGGAVDVAIRFGHLESSGLFARKLAVSSSVICASPAYLEKHGTPDTPDQLALHNCLSFRSEREKNQWRFLDKDGHVEVPISSSISANSLAFLKQAALSDMGIIMIPRWMVGDALRESRLVLLLEDVSIIPSDTPIHAIFAHKRHLAPKVRVFIDFLADHLALM